MTFYLKIDDREHPRYLKIEIIFGFCNFIHIYIYLCVHHARISITMFHKKQNQLKREAIEI